ncbi:CARDB domain-containing protein [Botryobacter ruber]|uniref:CARDB domain-containing protein n=1 Tax=Botryobacter ruber TaxID=2171629 RepID=UPI0013E2BAC9|nr:CARDB domain-containing protein [Botryobacter ruber]
MKYYSAANASASQWKLLLAVLLFFAGSQASFAQADLAIQGAAVSPTSVAVGNSVSATSTIYNLGNTAASSSNIGYYLSTDNTLDASDTFIGSSTGGILNASGLSGSFSYRNGTVTIPSNTAVGAYFILFVADYLNVVAEGNENNNVSSVSITVVPQSVDFTVTNLNTSATTVSPGVLINVDAYVVNQGNIASSFSNMGYYLSANTTLDASDVFIGSSSGNSIGAGSYRYFSSSVSIPANTVPGSYYLIFAADYLNQVAESNETNNTGYRAITVVAPYVDLVLQSPYIYNSSVTAGSTVGTEVRIHNLGNSSASSSNIGYYLSTNSTFDASDVFIGSSSGGTLTGGNYNYRSNSITIPANTAPGSYYIVFVADYLNLVTENNENNNIVSAAVTVVLPNIDLTLSSPSISQASVSAGNPVSVGVTINNQGNTAAQSSNIGYYLSSNSTFDESDLLIGFSNGSSLAAGNNSYRNESVTIPANTTPGTYYLFIVADYLNSVTESNENNNVISTAISVMEFGTMFLMPASGALNFTTCTGTLYDNGGTGNYSNYANGTVTLNPSVSGNKIRLTFSSFMLESCCDYLSIYDGTSTSAPLIGTYNGSNNPGTVYATNSTGALTLRFYTDGSATYSGFEAAIACVTSVPLADLVIQNPAATPTSLTAGNVMSVSSQVYNQGGVTAASSNVGYYLSTNNTFDPSDVYLGYSYGYSLTGGSVSSRNTNLTIPVSTAAGNYFLLFVADNTSLVTEENETNNVASVAITVEAATIDLLMLSAFPSSSTLTPGNAFSVSSFIANQGASTSPSSNVGYYLSANNTFESTDLFLGSSSGGALTSGNSALRSASLSLPATITAGTYYIFFAADHTNAVTETNEANNIRFITVTVSSSNFVDLEIASKTLASASIVAGESVSATANVKNNGNVAAPRSAVGFYLSSNTTLDQDDVLLNTMQTASTLAAGATEAVTANLTIPANTEAGSYYILFKSDYENHIAESNDANDLAYQAITVVGASVDLVVQTAAVAPVSIPAGQPVTATAGIRNQGSVAAAYSSIGYYLSANNTLDASDVLLNVSTGNALAAGTTANRSATLTIPEGTAAGSYFILFVADHAEAQDESSETNNVKAVALTVIAPTVDLAVQTPTVSAASVVAGTGITLTANVVNAGTVASTATTIRYYLSPNNTIESSDVVLGSADVSSMAASGSVSKVVSYTIPASTAAGNYFVLFQVDPDNTNTESNENNNTASVALAITLAPAEVDLAVLTPTVSAASVVSGGTVNVTSTIKNNGTTAAASSTVGYYLSADAVFNSADVVLESSSGGTLAAGATASRTATLTIPDATTAGNYYILFVADHANAVSETNETNNVASVALAVTAALRADLLVTAASVSKATTVAGDTIAVTATIQNSGQASAGGSMVGYYLSARNVWDNTAVRIGQSEVTTLAVGGTASPEANLIIPAGTAAGDYFVLVRADDTGAVTESSETNNVRSIAVTLAAPTVDLTVQPAAFVASVTAGNSYSFATEIRNSGNVAAASSNVGLYLSSNTSLESSDLLLSTITGGPLGAGSVAVRSSSITIPSNISPGTYYILVVADPADLVTESVETNNMQTASITVVASLVPDLRVHSPGLSASTVNADNIVGVSGTVTNIGTADAPAGKVDYYLSTNNTFESSDVLVGESNLPLLASGASSNVSANLRIPATTANGNYFVLLIADAANLIVEKDETNNLASIALTVSPPALPDLVVNSATVLQSNFMPGDTVAVTTTIQNNGPGSAAASSIGYYISDRNVWDNTATLLVQRQVTSLAAGGTTSLTTYMSVPAGIVAGTYYILVKADDMGVVTETNETNNVRSVAVTVIPPVIDLVAENITFEGTVYAGNSYNISAGIKNNGNVTSPSSNVGFYLSTNTTFDSSDVLLRSISGGPLANGSIATRSSNIIVPVGTAPGTYYMLAVVDHTGVIIESNETNNSRSFAFNLLAASALPDLNLHSPGLGTASVRAGDNAAVSNIVTNAGTGNAPAGKVNYYLSTNMVFDSFDTFLGESSVPQLAPGASSTQTASVLIPGTTASGSYYLLMVADAANVIPESDEVNNMKSVPVNVVHTLLPDLHLYSSFITSSVMPAGNQVSGHAVVANLGNANALAGSVSYYLSTDKIYDAADVFLAETALPIIEAGVIHHTYDNFRIPAGTPVGNYYVLVIADLGNLIAELDETNNMEALPLAISTTTGVDDMVADSKLSIWPNPASDVLTIEAANFGKGEKVAEVSLYNAIGEKIMSRQVAIGKDKLQTSFQVQHLDTGMYHLHIKAGNTVTVRKVVIQR